MSVFFARFVTGARCLAGPVAGALRMRRRAFFIANLIGALCYVPFTLGTGYALAFGWGRFRQVLSGRMALAMSWVVLALVAVFVIVGAIRLLRRSTWSTATPAHRDKAA